MANGLFTTPEQVLANRRAQAAKVIQGLNAKQGQSRAQRAFQGLGQMALSYGGMQQAKEEEEQLGALSGILNTRQAEQDAIAAVDRTAVPSQTTDVQGALSQGYSPQVLAQQEAATNKLRDKAIANSGLDRELQGSVKLEDTRRRNGLSQEGLIKSAQAVYAENPELALKMVAQAKAMQDTKGADFTLGDTRFNAEGEVIASNPKTVAPKDLVTKKEVQPDGTLRNVWYDKQGNLIKVGGIATDPSAKVKVNVENGVKPWAAINTQYRADTKDILSGYKDVKRVENALSVKGGASNQALQAGLADTFGGSTRALANLQQWASFGTLDERVANTVSKFVAGTYTDTSKKDAARLLHAYKTNLAREHQAINGRYERVGEANNVASNTFLLDVLETAPTLDFSSMSPQELLNVDDSNLEDWQVDDLTDAFKRLTQ
jgi:hypothetical protein